MIEVISRGIVYTNPKPHLHSRQAFHPTIVNLGNGELLCSFDVGEAVESLDYRTYKARSFDHGENWNFEGVLLGEYNSDVPTTSSMRINKVKDGLVGFGSLQYRTDPELGSLNRENLGYVKMDLILGRSDDKGKTWQGPEVISPPLVGPAFETCHNIVELPNGRWLAPTATWRGWDGDLSNGNKSVVLISYDQGKTWPEYGVTFDGGPNNNIHWEQSVIMWKDSIIAISWHFDPVKQQHLPNQFAVSKDNGNTFSEPGEIGIKGQTCKAINLDDEKILLAYRRIDKPGLWLGLYNFDGTTWELLYETPCWGTALKDSGMTGEGAGSDELSALHFGFPQMTRLDDGTVLMVFWGLEGWSSSIKWVKIGV